MKRSLLLLAAAALLCPSTPAAIIAYTASLSGANENPANASPATGFVVVAFDDIARTLEIDANFSGLTGLTTVAHIHCCIDPPGNVGVAVTPGTLPGFPAGVTSGTYQSILLDLTSGATYTASFITNFGGGTVAGAEAAFVAGLADGRAYFNIHSSTFGAGEIRGFLTPVPEPATWLLTAAPLLTLGFIRRRARR